MLRCQRILREYMQARQNTAAVDALSQEPAEEGKNTVFDTDDGMTRIVFSFATQINIEKKDTVPKWLSDAPETIKHFVLVTDDEKHKKRFFSAKNWLAPHIQKDLGKTIEFFDASELQFNVLNHDLVPQHEVIQDEQAKAKIIEQFELKNALQLPLILNRDPVARALGAQPGDIMKITRYTPNVGEHVVYRTCVRWLAGDHGS